MKNYLFLSLFAAATLVSCGKDKPVTSEVSDVTTTTEGAVYAIDTLNSKIEWTGYKIVKSENTSHFGTIKFESGDVTVKDNKLESGKFVANVATLESVDLKDDADSKGKLEGHLKSADFFDVEKFPTASYQITKVTEATDGGDFNTLIDGNLTIKGITKPISFKSNATVVDGVITINTERKDINRDEFGVKFMIPAANGLIKNEISLQISVKANEKK